MNVCVESSYPTASTAWPPSTCSSGAGMGTTPVLATALPSKLS